MIIKVIIDIEEQKASTFLSFYILTIMVLIQ